MPAVAVPVQEHDDAVSMTSRAPFDRRDLGRDGLDRHDVDVAATLAPLRHGRRDPTTSLRFAGRGSASCGSFVHATHTPVGPGTLQVRWSGGERRIDGFGPGAEWLIARAPIMLGADDRGLDGVDSSGWAPVVRTALANQRRMALGASGNLYHELLPTIIEQRITGPEAHQQWRGLCLELGAPAPGPFPELRLPPTPAALLGRPSWWFHPRGIERKRAEALRTVARHAARLWDWSMLEPTEAGAKLALLRGVGIWTIGTVRGSALGDPDAVAVGDYHLKNVIGLALAGEARATDERMLELLAPYAGQRGRVIRSLLRDGHGAQKFGPRQRILPMRRW